MMRRRLSSVTALLLLAACSPTDTVAPRHQPTPGHASLSDQLDGRMVPGSGGLASTAADKPLACLVEAPLYGSATIGARGGELDVGPHRLIIPPGALTADTFVSGSIPAGPRIEIDFAPQGLQFKKPAGLILDASLCGAVPNVVYLNEVGGIAERIQAVFSNWWHTIAAPIDHFSGYMLEV